MAQAKVKPLERKVLRDTVYESLVTMLMSGTLAPGTPLSIDGLAHELEVSPTPVREALVHLERTGLVSRAPLRGYQIAPPLNPQQISQLCEARFIVELGALDLAFRRNAHQLAAELARAHARHVKAGEDVSGVVPDQTSMAAYQRYMDADWAFHHAIFRLANNSYLLGIADSLPAHLHRLRQSVTRGINDSVLAIDEHAEVLRAVEDQDLERAKTALYDHIAQVRVRAMADESAVAAS